MEIAKGFTATDFKKLNLLSFTDLDRAIEVLNQRLDERYIEPADRLIQFENGVSAQYKKYGFTILAIDCLLIETLQSFYEGIIDSSGKSKDLFANFLLQRNQFSCYFKTKNDAKAFYKNFRCGILHQAQTFNNTKVQVIGDLISQRDGFTIVNRIKFHEAVKTEVRKYIELLKEKNDQTLINNFRKKMNFIANN